MDVSASTVAACSPGRLFAFVDDLGRYPAWIDLVHAAEPTEGDPPAWLVELRASVGPLARSKRLRMVRVEHDSLRHTVRFEREELDGRRHSPWTLEATVVEADHAAADAGEAVVEAGVADGDALHADGWSSLTMRLHYGGSLWTGGLMERVLADQISAGQRRLSELASPTH